jgi:hypothetical protein
MTSISRPGRAGAAIAALLGLGPAPALAHGFAGDRFFPATILTDDPFVADEMSLPTVTINPPGPDGSHQLDLETDLSKRITPDVGITLGTTWSLLKPKGSPSVTGMNGFHAELDYQLFVNAPHETMAMVGVDSNFGHTGRVQALGADDFTTLSPLLDFGKGFGDLPDSVPYLRPIAVTGNLSLDVPTKTVSAGIQNPNNFNYGFAFEYSLEYLQHHVKDVGLSAPFDHMVPLVEMSFSTALNRGQAGQTMGTIQPGLIWSGQYVQVGAEAIVPATRLAGHGYGGVVQFHMYLDDIFPATFGRPLFGR